MRYIGGKSKLAKSLATHILTNTTDRAYYVEPFIGGGSTFATVAPSFEIAVGGDLSEDLILMWQGLTDGTFVPPTSITEDQYAELRQAEPSALRGFVGYGGSFGGKFFGGFARGKKLNGEPRNYVDESARSIQKIAAAISGVYTQFVHTSYADLDISGTPGAVVYCDPPYLNTQGYTTGAFDTPAFWTKCAEWANNGATVFVSEYVAPEGWESVWSQGHRQSLALPEQGRDRTTEHLFMLKAGS